MLLLYAPTSPFARKVRVAAHELGLADRLELQQVDPWTDRRLRSLNPLAKVPTLVTDDGDVIYESGVVCDWFDALAGRTGMFPPDGPERWRALRLQGLADGALTAAGRLFAIQQGAHGAAMAERLACAIDATLDALEREPGLLTDRLTIGELSVALLPAYIQFRWPERNWRAHRPNLYGWWDVVHQRASFQSAQHSLAA